MRIKFISCLLGCLFINLAILFSSAFAADVSFSWLPNSEEHLAGYRIYYRLQGDATYRWAKNAGNPRIVNGLVKYTFGNFADNTTYCFAISAYDYYGNESEKATSDPLCYTTPSTPTSPPSSGDTSGDTSGDENNVPQQPLTIDQTIHIEVENIRVNSDWKKISFQSPFVKPPVVIAKPATNNDPIPCVIRIKDITSDGFWIRLQNWDYLPDDHNFEGITYIAIDEGPHILEDDIGNTTSIEAGFFETDPCHHTYSCDGMQTVTYVHPESFNSTPVVFASIVSSRDDPDRADSAVVSRIDNVTLTGFDYLMQEQQINTDGHIVEKVAYIAWEPFTGQINNYFYEIDFAPENFNTDKSNLYFMEDLNAPMLIADMQTMNGSDPANLRLGQFFHDEAVNLTTSVLIRVEEEASFSSDKYHPLEEVGYMAVVKLPDEQQEPPPEEQIPDDTLGSLSAYLNADNTITLEWTGGGEYVKIIENAYYVTAFSEYSRVYTSEPFVNNNFIIHTPVNTGTYNTYKICQPNDNSKCSGIATVNF